MSICCDRTDFSVLTGLFAVLGWPTDCQRKGGGRRGGHGWMDRGVRRWRGDKSPRERESGGLLERTSWTTKLTCSSSWFVLKKAL